tara:strand:- start:41 stop:631 length:591 start_codon:yes stop_codon:yes gene_type:complete
MEMNWKDWMGEFWGCLALTWVIAGAASGGIGATTLGLGVAMIILWATFSGAHIIPALTAAKMFNDQDWETGGMKLLWQILGTVGFGVLALICGNAGTAGADAAAIPFDDITHIVTMVVGGGILYTVWNRCDAWVTAFAVAAAFGAMSLGGGVAVGNMLAGLANEGSFGVNTLGTYVLDVVLAGVGGLLAVKVEEQL